MTLPDALRRPSPGPPAIVASPADPQTRPPAARDMGV